MDFIQAMGLIIVAGFSATLWFFRRGGIYNPLPSIDNLAQIKPKTPIVAPSSNPNETTPTEANNEQKEVLLWATPKQAWHSVRVLCDETGLTYDQKNEVCYTIYRESEFHIGAIGKPNKNGTRDYGICQFNDGKNAKGVPFWIGKGATFKDINEVLTNPEKCVRVMIQTYKAGNIGWWYGHRGYSQVAVQNSPMWKLKGV